MKQWMLNQLQQTPCVEECTQGFSTIQAATFIDKAMTLAASFVANPRSIVYVARNAYGAENVYQRLVSLLPFDKVEIYTVEESLRVEAISASPEQGAHRVEVLNRLLKDDQCILVTHSFALSKIVPLVDDFKHQQIHLEVNQSYRMDDLCQRLSFIGYTRVAHVYAPLTYARRGFVVDIYPIDQSPLRIEYFDDEIESIKTMDVQTQRSLDNLNSIDLTVASDLFFNQQQINEIQEKVSILLEKETDPTLLDNVNEALNHLNNHAFDASLYPYVALINQRGYLLDYVPNAQVVADPINQINDSLKYYQMEATAYIQELVEYKRLLPKFAIFHPSERIQKSIQSTFNQFTNESTNIHEVECPSKVLSDNLKFISADTNHRLKVISVNENDAESIISACIELGIDYALKNEEDDLDEGINLLFESFSEGLSIDSLSLIVYTSNELFKRKSNQTRFANKFKQAEVLNTFNQLNINDYVVHNQYGVGQYVGIVTRVTNGLKKDYLHILYADNGELYVPLEQFHLVRRFVAGDGVVPRLNKLGTDTWKKTQAKLRESLQDLAQRLVELYRNRKKQIGFAFAKDSEHQAQFENEFEYPLTPDQDNAVKAIKQAMEQPYPMDYLLAGDVGFGKTEVAIRCAFKAIESGKQVAFLCPTTLLSRQHYITCINRFNNYPINVGLLNRFVSGSVTKQTLQGLKNGSVDIVVGTHRLLSKDIEFKDLGLLIIDEEHRFGVEQKERIAEIKQNVDVLSLSATPIPRTMQMSLMGVRASSQLTTPPNNRYPVATYVVEHNEKLIKEVMERELARKGQVFYLFNHTVEIYPYARKIQQLLPHAKVGIAHGQMDALELENTMDAFIQGNIDILLCTTVIENGIDIPNANTILVDNAHKLGLAQLYQIKGRVGRSTRMGYAYLMIPAHSQLSEIAQKRLNAIKEFANLGDGYQLAMRDLMIRGAGDLLGAKQSGFINTVGIDMVIDILKEEIEIAQDPDKEKKEIIKKQILPLNATIPNTFTQVNFDKLDIVSTLEKCEDKQSLLTYQEKIKDEYGKLPSEVEELFLKRRFEIVCSLTKMEKIMIGKTMVIIFNQALSNLMDGELLFDTVYRLDNLAKISFKNGKVSVEWMQTTKKNLAHSIQLMENINALLKKVR